MHWNPLHLFDIWCVQGLPEHILGEMVQRAGGIRRTSGSNNCPKAIKLSQELPYTGSAGEAGRFILWNAEEEI